MQLATPLTSVQATLHLNGFQQEEFARVARMYRLVTNYLLEAWRAHTAKTPLPHVGLADHRFLTHKLNSLFSFSHWVQKAEHGIAYCAMNELYRRLVEHYRFGQPAAELCALDEAHVVFYKQYRLHLREQTADLPIVGRVRLDHLPAFCGSIRAVGVDRNAKGEYVCSVYHERADAPGQMRWPVSSHA